MQNTERTHEKKLYIALFSVHGLIRGKDMELGRDADTGGQVKYVVELARALGRHPEVERVDLITRKIVDKRVDASYAVDEEPLGENANIIRIESTPRRYLYKEKLWPYLDGFIDKTLLHFRSLKRPPDVIHGHYADAGYVASHLASLLGVPMVFTGHSLGRVKQERLLEKGTSLKSLEQRYNLTARIEAEETALDTASMVVASTRQEVRNQYQIYDHYQPQRMKVIPPGVDLSRFQPPEGNEEWDNVSLIRDVKRFLHDPDKPCIFAMARPDERKNFGTLIRAYAEHPELRNIANLILVAGNRDDISDLDSGARKVLYRILRLIDKYDLYGHVAYPKMHEPDEVPLVYRYVSSCRGIFVNPALTEPFGLTLIEAAASGLPLVATNDGGPQDIMSCCHNGLLIDPLNKGEMADALYEMLSDSEKWTACRDKGLKGVQKHYSWNSHVQSYLPEVRKIMKGEGKGHDLFALHRSRLPSVDRILITDVDNTLIGDECALNNFLERLEQVRPHTGFAIATGRSPGSALQAMQDIGAPDPDILITCVGTEIYYGRRLTLDRSWKKHIDYHWYPNALRSALEELPGLSLQQDVQQREFKISFDIDPEEAPTIPRIKRYLRQQGLRAKVIYSHEAYLDVVPIRASNGLAIRYLMIKWGLTPEQLLVAGDSGNDEEMLSGNTLGVVVGNYSPELEKVRNKPRIYFATAEYANGILEGIDYYDFFGNIHIPQEEDIAGPAVEIEDDTELFEDEAEGLESKESRFS